MFRYNRLSCNTKDIQTLYNSALVRYDRGDPVGASDTLRNMAKSIGPKTNFYKLEAIPGTIEDALAAFNNNKPKLTLKILKHLSLEMHYGRLQA